VNAAGICKLSKLLCTVPVCQARTMLEAKAADLAEARGEASELLSRLSLATDRIKVGQ
jgi:hypothetical protein